MSNQTIRRRIVRKSSSKADPKPTEHRLSIVYQDLTELHPYANNPRNNAAAIQAVANSIRTFGFRVPIIVDASNTIIAGHTRYLAAQSLGLTQVPTTISTDLTEDQIKAFRLADNKVSELATWDASLLGEEMRALADAGISFTDFGWRQDEIDCLSDLVAEDCLSTGVAAATDIARSNPTDPRAPSRSRFVCSEFVFFIPSEVYRRWAAALRADHDYDEAAIERELKDRLGITPYLEAAES